MDPKKFEAIIIGAGSTGSSIAFNLVKKGVSNILVVDMSCVGCGQTSRSSAIIRLHYTNPEVRKMAVYSWRFWRDKFVEETGCEHDVFSETGVVFAGSREHREAMEEVVSDLKKMNTDVELYEPDVFKKEIFKYFNDEGLDAIAWEPHSGHCDPNTAVQCFISYSKDGGAKIMEGKRVDSLILDGEVVTGVKIKGEMYKADFIVNAMGVWANDILRNINLELPITVGKEEVLYLLTPEKREVVPPGWEDLALGFYSRPEGKTQTLIGGMEAEETNEEPIPGEYTAPPVHLIRMRSDPFLKRFPDMKDAKPHAAIIGYYDITPDWQPIIGFDHRVKNLIHMVGLSGHGFKLAPAFGDIISDLIIHGSSKTFNIEGFSMRRFEKQESKHSKYKYGIVG
jgi:glycine/D-amino acid oxidase-like deaminating enzyme